MNILEEGLVKGDFMDKKLYLIANNGCDDTTHGLVRFTDEEFSIFKENVENLNRNSTYGCMPTISVFSY